MLPACMSGCRTAQGPTPDEQRAHVQQMRTRALNRLYVMEPKARAEVASAPGFAVFDVFHLQVVSPSTGNGYGVVRDNRTGADTYMRSVRLGAGLGAGVRNYRAVIVFKDEASMDRFVNGGPLFGAEGVGEAKTDGQGAGTSGMAPLDRRVQVYTFGEDGLMAGVSVGGGKVWKDPNLN